MINESDLMGLVPLVQGMISGREVNFQAYVSNESPRLMQQSSYSTTSGEKRKTVQIIPLKSVITKYDYCYEMGMVSFERLLKQAKADDSIGAVVLDMDTGGGEASYMPHVAKALRELREQKPVLTYFSGCCASAGYYILSQTTKAYASHENDIVGSIGTMVSAMIPNENAEFNWVRVYATKSTEKNKAWEELISGKPESYIKNILDPFNEAFHNDVKLGRPNLPEEVFTGISMNASEGLALNLIDGIKTFEEVVDEAFSLIKN